MLTHESRQLRSWLIFDVGQKMTIRPFSIEQYDEVFALWQRTPGICVRDADSRESIDRYLRRNPGMSFLAALDGRIVGSALSGHDGRRGYLQHVVVDTAYRKRGIAHELVARCLAALERDGISKVHLDVLASNLHAQEYWAHRGWLRRDDLYRFSKLLSKSPNS